MQTKVSLVTTTFGALGSTRQVERLLNTHPNASQHDCFLPGHFLKEQENQWRSQLPTMLDPAQDLPKSTPSKAQCASLPPLDLIPGARDWHEEHRLRSSCCRQNTELGGEQLLGRSREEAGGDQQSSALKEAQPRSEAHLQSR